MICTLRHSASLGLLLFGLLLIPGELTAQQLYFPFEASVTANEAETSYEGSALAHVLRDDDEHLVELQLTGHAGERSLILSLLARQPGLELGTYDATAPIDDIRTIQDGFERLPVDAFVTLAGFSTNPRNERLSVESGELVIEKVTDVAELTDLPGDLTPEALEELPITNLVEGSITYTLRGEDGTTYRVSGSFKALETVQDASDEEGPLHGHPHGGHSH